MRTVYDLLLEWKPKFDPQGPECYVVTNSTTYSGSVGYLTNTIWADDMKALGVVEYDEDRHIIYAEKI